MRWLDKSLAMATWLLGSVLLLSVLLNFMNAFMRYVMGDSIMWAEEIMVFALIFIVMLGMVVVTAQDTHLKIDIFSTAAPPSVQKGLRLLSSLAMCLVCGYLAVQSSDIVSMMLRLGQTSVAARLPMWIPHSFVLAAMVLSSVAGALLFVREALGLRPDEAEKEAR
jgi:TRAP-type C4-dicarboxylate transport system permease small subunit